MIDDLLQAILLMIFWVFIVCLTTRESKKIKWDKKANYSQYIRSSTWRRKRQVILNRDNYCCRLCGSTNKLHIHHLTYEHFGNERGNELITLCSKCHAKQHKRVDRQ